jgi:hypothetical protein
MKIDTTQFKVKADNYQLLLYEKGEADSPDSTVPGEELRGYVCVGHYTTTENLLRGLRWRLVKQKSKRAQTLLQFVETNLALLQAAEPAWGEIAAKAVAARAKVKARPELPARDAAPERMDPATRAYSTGFDRVKPQEPA